MTTRDQLIIGRILHFLDQLDGGQAVDTLIHSAVSLDLEPRATLDEFESCMLTCEAKRWVRAVRSHVTGRSKWSLTDLGRAALADLAPTG